MRLSIKKLFFFSFVAISLTGFANNAYADDEAEATGKSITCNKQYLEDKYIGQNNANNQEKCWYCRVVIIMTNAYLKATEQALPVVKDLGLLVVKLGFAIWLALFILKQISSIGGITPGKMLQEILTMGFKCAFAHFAIKDGLTFITNYILNPILITGTDIGNAIFAQMGVG